AHSFGRSTASWVSTNAYTNAFSRSASYLPDAPPSLGPYDWASVYLVHEGKVLEPEPSGVGAVIEEQVGHLNRAILGFDHVGLDLRLPAGALADEHAFQPVLGGHFDVDGRIYHELDGVIHGSTSFGRLREGCAGVWWLAGSFGKACLAGSFASDVPSLAALLPRRNAFSSRRPAESAEVQRTSTV